MPALTAGIHVLMLNQTKNVDGRNELGHDELKARSQFIEPERVAGEPKIRRCAAARR